MFDFGDDGESELLGRGTGTRGEPSPLSESLALKAFLRIKREERKRNPSNLFQSSPSPFSKDRSHYSLSYDPEATLPEKAHPSHNDYAFDEFANVSDSKDTTFASRGSAKGDERNQPQQSRSFNSMHAIINESFQEKIDYQRKLREQQSELLALKDKLHQLQIENLRLTQTTIKLNQRQLPLAFAQVMKIRRRTKVGFPPSLTPSDRYSSCSFNSRSANGSNSTIT
jgi:hypothetical protein